MNIMEEIKRPEGHNTINTFIIVKNDATKFIKFTESVFEAKEKIEVRTPDRDGKLIHAEVRIGNSTLMIADSKEDWPFTPSFVQIYVNNIKNALELAKGAGAIVVTELSPFYGGYNIARIKDPFGNIWWLYEHDIQKDIIYDKSDTSWHDRKPSYIYLTLVEAMINLK
jgi:uncharacterized glyoxalase superfamily protein PhnB